MSGQDDEEEAATLRHQAEQVFHHTASAEKLNLSTDALVHELRVHQIELEMQNETLRVSQLALEVARDRYADLYEFAPIGYLTLTAEGMIAEINLTAVTLLGTTRDQLLNKSLRGFMLESDRDRWIRHLLHVRKRGVNLGVELQLRREDGSLFYALLDCMVNRFGSDEAQVRVAMSDISERKRAEVELRIAAIAFTSQNGMMITDAQGVIQRVNAAFTQLTGYTAEEAVGQTPALLQSGRQDVLFYQRMWATLAQKGYWQGEVWNKRKSGNIYAEMLSITAIYSAEQQVTHYVGSFTDITQSKAAEAEIHRLAYYDPLTELPNRRLLQDRLSQAIISARRSDLYGVMFFLDLDHFKELNDTRGHDVGDVLLRQVAERLDGMMCKKGIVARQGGDEFVVLIEGLGNTAQDALTLAQQVGKTIHTALTAPFNLNGYEYHCKSSIGGALFHACDTVEELFKHADLALYQAKKMHGNQVRFFDPAMQQALEQRSRLEAELSKAVEHNQLSLDYQPQMNRSRQIVGVEALLRWQHPQRGLILPDEFIPLAEETGLILPIGQWALETACAQIKQWECAPLTRTLTISVNVSARQFCETNFVEQVKTAIANSGIQPANLKLELTESLVLNDIRDTIAKMQTIKQLGVQFSMDDFGTGYSSLAYLAQLPLDQLKIDKSFVQKLFGTTQAETIVRAIITMGLGLNLHVIAEGVETQAQLDFLDAHGCHAYQGYLFSHPLPILALNTLLQSA